MSSCFLFNPVNFINKFTTVVKSHIAEAKEIVGKEVVDSNASKTGLVIDKVKVAFGAKFSLMGYNYPLLGDLLKFNQIPVASLPDLAAMKLSTILSRGTKRDLIDIYFLAKKYKLEELFVFYDEKFGNFDEREVMIKKALIYFDEADEDEMPDMLVPADWKEIKNWFVKQVKNL